MRFNNLECIWVKFHPERKSVIQGPYRITHHLYIFEVRSVGVFLQTILNYSAHTLMRSLTRAISSFPEEFTSAWM